MGKPVIAPEGVGLIPEFGPTLYLRRYPAGDVAALVRLVTQCHAEKLQASRLVADRTWDHWAAGHHELFGRLLRKRRPGVACTRPGFWLRGLAELDLAAGTDVAALEGALDRVARPLYFGDYLQTRALLQDVVTRFPEARRLLERIPA